VETEIKGEYTNRKIVQIYVDGQPVVSKGGGRTYGKSPEELEQTARLMILAYAKDLAVAKIIHLDDITFIADNFYTWLKGGDNPVTPTKQTKAPTEEQEFENLGKPETEKQGLSPTGKKVQNIAELKSLLMKHKIGTAEAYEILSISAFTELTNLDEAWAKVKEAKGIE